MKKFDYIVYIGRFQPPHLAHTQIVKQGLKQATNVIVLVGSANQPRTFKNPFTWQEREVMIRASLSADLNERVVVMPIRDKVTDAQWVTQIQRAVDTIEKTVTGSNALESSKIGIIGHSKDESSYYLEMFPQWENIEVENIEDMHATDIREAFFGADDEDDFELKVGRNLPHGIHDWMKAFMMTAEYEQLRREFLFNRNYRRAWDWDATLDAFLENDLADFKAEDRKVIRTAIEQLRTNYKVAPYENNYYCADAVVVQAGHILLIRRRSEPGKNLWALPGGHVGSKETSLDAAIRELREETRLKVPVPVLRGSLHKKNPTHLFEKPDRSLRGRTLSKAYYFVLEPGPLPKVKGGDDADKAKWVPLSTFAEMEDQMFEDHFHIVNYFLGSGE